MTIPRISVAMSVYNNALYLPAAIESILAQSFGDFEFLIVNDGSKDESGRIIDDYAARDSRIRPLHQENRGLVSSLNRLIAESRAPLLARMDGDDIALPERFTQQIAFLDSHPDYGIVGSWCQLINAEGADLSEGGEKPVSHEEIQAKLKTGPLFAHSSVIYRTDLARAAGGYHAAFKHCEDVDLWLRLSQATRMANLPDRLMRYRVYADQVSSRHLVEQAVNSFISYKAFLLRQAGKPDPTANWDTMPPLSTIDAALGWPGAAREIREELVAFMQYDPAGLAAQGMPILVEHIRQDRTQAAPLWRIAARLFKAGRGKAALQAATALLRRSAFA